MLRIRHCGTALSASLCVQAHSLGYMSVAESAGRRHKALQTECSLFITYTRNLLVRSVVILALTFSKTEREEQRRRGRERRKERKSVLLRQSRQSRRTRICTQSLVRSVFFCTKATSGIMMRRRLMCESRVCPCPQGFAEWQMGETREEGGHMLDMFALGNLY